MEDHNCRFSKIGWGVVVLLSVINICFISWYFSDLKLWEDRVVDRLYARSEGITEAFDKRLMAIFTERNKEWTKNNIKWNKWLYKIRSQWFKLHPSFQHNWIEIDSLDSLR